MNASVWFTVAVLAVFVAAIVYTAICARAAVAAESADADHDVIEPASGAPQPPTQSAAHAASADIARAA